MEKANILIVDDDPDITEAMKIVLENQDYGVNSAGSIEQAMESLKAQRPDLIILDIVMPKMNGIVFMYELKKNMITQKTSIEKIPIIAMSGNKLGKRKLVSAYFLGAVETTCESFPVQIPGLPRLFLRSRRLSVAVHQTEPFPPPCFPGLYCPDLCRCRRPPFG